MTKQPKESKKPKLPKELTAPQANRLAIEQQVLHIRCLENALQYKFKGVSKYLGQPVDQGHLIRAKEQLIELDRLRGIYESEAYGKKELPYIATGRSNVDKVKAHFDAEDGEFLFLEVKSSSSGRTVVDHMHTKSHINKSIKKKIMATKKKAAKKAPAKTAKKAVAKKRAAPKKKEGDSIRSRVDMLVGKGLDNKAIMEALDKEGIVYSITSVRWYASKARALA